jgi:hypothetical protein
VTRKEWPPGGNSWGPEDQRAATGGSVSMLPHARDTARFGRPSSYSLSRRELSHHIRELRQAGWMSWEIRARFDYWPAA